MLFFDTEHKRYLTLEELKKQYESDKQESPSEFQDMTFTQYVNNCLVENDGTLVKTRK